MRRIDDTHTTSSGTRALLLSDPRMEIRARWDFVDGRGDCKSIDPHEVANCTRA